MLTAVVVAHNEEEQLNACLSLLEFCDRLIVVLDRCTDGSEEIARRYTDRLSRAPGRGRRDRAAMPVWILSRMAGFSKSMPTNG